ncbi:hypothetical protein RUM8411_03211 [Ruegeria meonggei]|uniref:Uncharacterized protein n=2 Tax=Ruegeria meonggei TaxID=1446476 RepID=A0A1X6ZXB7_9RHOB|nr:hypothetical protein RUM8411_03211 [Ruegeria meonggei]
MFDCMVTGKPSFYHLATGAIGIFVGLTPLLASLFLLYSLVRKRSIGVLPSILIWGFALCVGGLGVYGTIVDPGDMYWGGLPLAALGACLCASLLSFKTHTAHQQS